MKPVVSYEITDGDRPGYFNLYRVVRHGDVEARELMDVRCKRERLEEVAWLWRQPGGWINFF